MAKNRKYPTRKDGKITKEYRAWKAMKARCYAPCNKDMGKYQKLNIEVCERWFNSFDNFMDDMGEAPEGLSLDRIDPTKDYSKDNCRWASWKEQSSNRGSFNKLFTYNNETLVLKDWAKKLGIKYTTLYLRIYRSGLSFEEAIKEDPFNRLIEYNGDKKSLKEWSKILNIKYQIIVDRIHKGWDISRVFTQKVK